MNIFLCFLTLLLATTVSSNGEEYPPPCDSPVYCYGELLHIVQVNRVFKDQKEFVDRPMRTNQEDVLKEFEKFDAENPNKTKEQIKAWVDTFFEEDGQELKVWTPPDWKENPTFLDGIADPDLRKFGEDIHGFWKILGREMIEDVRLEPEKYSIIHVEQPSVVPGGRFKEFYYWDSYWIQRGLLLSEMPNTVKGMIENYIEMVDKLGYVPNGGRIYFERSQPPLLIPMVWSYYQATKDIEFVRKNYRALEREFNFYYIERSITFSFEGKQYTMARYFSDKTGPRPESYWDDFELAEMFREEVHEDELYTNIKAACESGWDFSSRWFYSNESNQSTTQEPGRQHTKTINIVPVDLNAIIYMNADTMANFCILLDDPTCSEAFYRSRAEEYKLAIRDVMWQEDANKNSGAWFDLYVDPQSKLATRRTKFYASNIVPLWAKAYDEHDGVEQKVLNYLRQSGALDFPAGVPSSLDQTGEQWDFPNGWAPSVHLIVEGLSNTQIPEAREVAFEIAQKWVLTNHVAYQQTELMFEKYDVTTVGAPGGGGEYDVVVGFGWTNGVIVDFLHEFGHRLETIIVPNNTISNEFVQKVHLPNYRKKKFE